MKQKSPMEIELEEDKIEADKLARRIIYKRRKLHISQESHGVNSSLDRTYLTHIENSKRNPSYTNLRKILKGLNETFETFYKDYDKEPKDDFVLKEERFSIEPTFYLYGNLGRLEDFEEKPSLLSSFPAYAVKTDNEFLPFPLYLQQSLNIEPKKPLLLSLYAGYLFYQTHKYELAEKYQKKAIEAYLDLGNSKQYTVEKYQRILAENCKHYLDIVDKIQDKKEMDATFKEKVLVLLQKLP
jgi:transcriptional regulator with XRE-family HTH domain